MTQPWGNGPGPKRAVEMTGLWKAWKAPNRLPTLSTSPLEISPTAGEIPTFPQPGEAVWKSGKPKTGFPLSHPASRRPSRFHFEKAYGLPPYAASRRQHHQDHSDKKGTAELNGFPNSKQKGDLAADRVAPSSRLILQ